MDNDGRQISASWRQAANKVPQKLKIIFTCWRISIRRCLYPSDPLFDQVTVHICLSFQVTHAEKLTISFAELCLILYVQITGANFTSSNFPAIPKRSYSHTHVPLLVGVGDNSGISSTGDNFLSGILDIFIIIYKVSYGSSLLSSFLIKHSFSYTQELP